MSLSLFDLKGKVAIVTGSGKGIGKAVAKGIARAGASVVVIARTVADIEATANEIKKDGGVALPVPADVTKDEQISNLIKKTMDEFGKIDVLVNNAGGVIKVERAVDMSKSLWDEHLSKNLDSVFMMSQAVGRIMLKQGKGSIINISSLAAEKPVPGRVAYNVAKAGVSNLTISLALEWGRYNVRVNAIMPGHIETPFSKLFYNESTKDDLNQRLEFTPLRRFGKPEDLIGATIFLASDASEFITGAILPVDGGLITVMPKRRDDPAISLW